MFCIESLNLKRLILKAFEQTLNLGACYCGHEIIGEVMGGFLDIDNNFMGIGGYWYCNLDNNMGIFTVTMVIPYDYCGSKLC